LQKSLPKAATGSEIVKLAAFPVGSTMKYTAPDGQPAYLFRTNAGVFAYSAVCTHQGCVVDYNSLSKTLNCPCHGGQFDPFNGGKVLQGPPPTPLATYKVAIKGDAIVTA
jgi:Rieske Fe-S protein